MNYILISYIYKHITRVIAIHITYVRCVTYIHDIESIHEYPNMYK